MMTASKLFARALLLASAALIAVGPAHAQAPGEAAYPGKQVRLITTYPPGGASDIKQRFEKIGVEALAGTPEALRDFVRSESERWGKLVQEAGIRAD